MYCGFIYIYHRLFTSKQQQRKTELSNKDISSCDISCIFRRSLTEDTDGRVCCCTPRRAYQWASKHQLVYCTVWVNKLSKAIPARQSFKSSLQAVGSRWKNRSALNFDPGCTLVDWCFTLGSPFPSAAFFQDERAHVCACVVPGGDHPLLPLKALCYRAVFIQHRPRVSCLGWPLVSSWTLQKNFPGTNTFLPLTTEASGGEAKGGFWTSECQRDGH